LSSDQDRTKLVEKIYSASGGGRERAMGGSVHQKRQEMAGENGSFAIKVSVGRRGTGKNQRRKAVFLEVPVCCGEFLSMNAIAMERESLDTKPG